MGAVRLAGIRKKNGTSHGIHVLGYAGRSIPGPRKYHDYDRPPSESEFRSIGPALEA